MDKMGPFKQCIVWSAFVLQSPLLANFHICMGDVANVVIDVNNILSYNFTVGFSC
jgi:hypothetical protein